MINEIFQFSVIQNQSLTTRNGCKLDDITCILVLFFRFWNWLTLLNQKVQNVHCMVDFFLKLRTKHGKEIKYLTQ